MKTVPFFFRVFHQKFTKNIIDCSLKVVMLVQSCGPSSFLCCLLSPLQFHSCDKNFTMNCSRWSKPNPLVAGESQQQPNGGHLVGLLQVVMEVKGLQVLQMMIQPKSEESPCNEKKSDSRLVARMNLNLPECSINGSNEVSEPSLGFGLFRCVQDRTFFKKYFESETASDQIIIVPTATT